eukprot:2647222-Rhodomonas_salina.1
MIHTVSTRMLRAVSTRPRIANAKSNTLDRPPDTNSAAKSIQILRSTGTKCSSKVGIALDLAPGGRRRRE